MSLKDLEIKNFKPPEKPQKLYGGGGLYLYLAPYERVLEGDLGLVNNFEARDNGPSCPFWIRDAFLRRGD
jgi:hypothetical protein